MFEKVKIEDWARLAAYIDGEGHISIASAGGDRNFKMQLTIGNTDHRLTSWLKNTFGGEVRLADITKRRRQYWYWYIGSKRASDFLSRCLPFFIMKREQAEIAIAYHATVSGFKMVGGKRTVSPEIRMQREFFAESIKKARADAAPVIN